MVIILRSENFEGAVQQRDERSFLILFIPHFLHKPTSVDPTVKNIHQADSGTGTATGAVVVTVAAMGAVVSGTGTHTVRRET
jgi:hypothetical protein